MLAARQAWAHAIFTRPKPLPAQDIAVTGQQLVPLASALALAALACLAAVMATRSVAQARPSASCWPCSAPATAAAVLVVLRASAVLAAARASALSGPLGGSTTSGSPSGGRGA